MTSFFLMGAKQQLSDHPLIRLDGLIDWQRVRSKLVGIHKRDLSHGGGPEPYDEVAMFKLVLLGQWHRLSDPESAHALRVRLDFMVFCGFEPGAAMPDDTTICRFRNHLCARQIDRVLFADINRQLEHLGLKVQGARGAVIDATIITSAAKPRRQIQIDQDGQSEFSASADADARWVKKGKHAFFGYRGFAAMDTEDGYVEAIDLTPANQSEVTMLEPMLDQLPETITGVLADKGYASRHNRERLQQRGLSDLIQHKAAAGKPLLPWQRLSNRLIATLRYKVEQGFGTIKRRFGLARARYFGTQRVRTQFTLVSICFNLLKASNKLKALRPAQPSCA